MRILMANTPRSYREVMAFAFQELRPHVEVISVEPEALDLETLRLRPELVMCDHASLTVKAVARSWMELRIEGAALVMATSTSAIPTDVRNGDFGELLAFIDRYEEVVERRS